MASLHSEPFGGSAEKHIVDADPSAGAGLAAPQGSVAYMSGGTAAWIKSGAGATAWDRMDVAAAGQGVSPANTLDLSTNPTATDTVTIGSDVYEFLAAAGTTAAAPNIGVEIKGSAALTFAEFLAAVNGSAADPHANILAFGGGAAPGVGTELVLASDFGSQVAGVCPADAVGGNLLPSSPDIAFSDALTAAVNWASTNLNLLGGFASVSKAASVIPVTVSAAHVTAGGIQWLAEFTPRALIWQATHTNGIQRLTQNDYVFTSGPMVQLTLAGGGAPDIQANDEVTIALFE